MSTPTPNTTIKLISGVNFDDDYKNTLYFSSKSAQSSFFDSLVVATLPNNTYQRYSTGVLKVKGRIDDYMECNYLYFCNSSHENKRYYCFITNVEYVNENTTYIYYKIDVIQTYMFDWSLLNSFIARQHQSGNDNVGSNIIEENFNLGLYKSDYFQDISFNNMCMLLLTTCEVFSDSGVFTMEQNNAPHMSRRNNIVDGCELNLIEMGIFTAGNESKRAYFETMINRYADRISAFWLYPRDLITVSSYIPTTGGLVSRDFTFSSTSGVTGWGVNLVNRPTSIDGYTPRNNKLLTYPYCFAQVSNNCGQTCDLRFEKFNSTDRKLNIIGTTTAEGKTMLYPMDYNGSGVANQQNFEYGIQSFSYPTVSYIGDAYSIYLAQNRNTLTNNMDIISRNYNLQQRNLERSGIETLVNTLGNAVSTVATGGSSLSLPSVSGIINQADTMSVNLENQVSSAVASLEDAKTRPNTVSGLQSQGINIQYGKTGYTQYIKCIDSQHARMIDDFFTVYGYAQNKVATPNINARSKYTYIKTIGLNISGDFPNDHKNQIIKIFDSGITFWKENVNIGNYSIANTPI